MNYDQWGDVFGDSCADGIIADRKKEFLTLQWTQIIGALPFIPSLVWYYFYESRIALIIIVLTVLQIIRNSSEMINFKSYTFLLITERRAQLIEQQLREIRDMIR